MPAAQPPEDLDDLLALARDHGLELEGSSLRTEEMGLDLRVAFGRAHDGQRWVLRLPRRVDVLSRADVEGRLLELIAPRLDVAVPEWRISSPELIAYPLLPGLPGLSLETDGTVTWRIDISSVAYAESLGQVVSQLHGIDAADAAATGIEVRSPAQVREAWTRDLDRVAAEFEIAPAMRERWRAWIAEDSYWPRLAEHCAEMFSASPVAYGLFALETGEVEHRAAAAAVLNPAEEA